METGNKQLNDKLQARFTELPKVVQDAITSAEVEHHLRRLADTYKLHIDQWQLLENEVMLTLMGFLKPEELEGNIKHDVGLDAEVSKKLADDISTTVFEPIRAELERQLEHPDAKAVQLSTMDASRKQMLSEEGKTATAPATPPAAKPDGKAQRAPFSETYAPKATSVDRKAVEGDPYREQLG